MQSFGEPAELTIVTDTLPGASLLTSSKWTEWKCEQPEQTERDQQKEENRLVPMRA